MYKWKLAFRYCFRRRITLLAMAAVALCVFIVVVVMTVMNGLVEQFREKNHEFVGDCIVSTESLVGFGYYEEFLSLLDEQAYVAAAAPVVQSFGLLTMPGADWNIGVEIMGLDLERHIRVTEFEETLYYHKDDPLNAFVPSYAPQLPGTVLGIDLMPRPRDRSGQYYHSAQPIRYELIVSSFPLTAKGALTRAGTDLVNTKKFFLSDDSHSGLVQADGKAVYLPFETAQLMFGMEVDPPRVHAIHVRFAEGGLRENVRRVRALWEEFRQSKAGENYASLLDGVRVESWIENRREIVAPMEKEQTMLGLLFLMLGVITVFIIFVVFYMIIGHKSKDIGILKSVGVSGGAIMQVFLLFAGMVGVLGAAVGVVGGWVFLRYINDIEGWLFAKYNWQLWDRSVYAIGAIPHEAEWPVLGMIALAAVGASLLGAALPSWQAARRRPAEILQVAQI